MVMEEKWVYCDYCKTQVKRKMGEVDCYFKDSPKEEECPYKKLPEAESSQAMIPGSPPGKDRSANKAPFEPISEQKTIPYSSPGKPSEEPAFYGKAPFESVSGQKTIPYSSPDKPSKEVAFYKEATLPPLIVPEPSPSPNPFQPPMSQPPPPPAVKSRKRRRARIFLAVVILVLLAGNGAMGYYSLQWHSQILSQNSTIATQTAIIQQGQAVLTATIQAQGTVIQNKQATQAALAQQLSNLQATSTAVAANTPLGAILDSQSQYATVSKGQAVSVTFTLKNTGTSTWSNQDGFSFNCTSDSGHHSDAVSHGWTPVCPNPGKLTFIDGTTVPTGQTYPFIFLFPTSSLTAGTIYVTYWRLAYNGLPFGSEVYILVTVKS